MTLGALESRPDICLDVFQHMPEMDCSIGIGQCAGYQNPSLSVFHIVMLYRAVRDNAAFFGPNQELCHALCPRRTFPAWKSMQKGSISGIGNIFAAGNSRIMAKPIQ
jgi:hypothetical protein